MNLTPFASKYSLMKLTMAAQLAPAALQASATNLEPAWTVFAAVLCVIVAFSAGFRFLWSHVLLFRFSILANVAAQLVAFGLSTLTHAKWPTGAGLVSAFALGVVCVIFELNIAHHYKIPDKIPE